MRRTTRTLLLSAGLGAALLAAPRDAPAQAAADTARPVLEVFTSTTCPHCAAARRWLPTLQRAHPTLVVRIHEVDRDPEALARLYRYVGEQGGTLGVPAFVARGRLIVGWGGAATTGRRIERLLFPDTAARTPADTTAGSAGPPPADAIEVRLLGRVSAAQLGLPLFTIVLGLLDGFNPCAMWVLVFVLSLLVGMRERRRIVIIGGTFLLASGLVYFAFMAAWLNVFLFVGVTRVVQVVLGLVALAAAVLNIKDFFALGTGPTLSIPEAAKPTIYAQVRRVVSAERLGAAVGAAIVLALLVNTVELLCTSGIPAVYTQVLAGSDLSRAAHYGYLALYNVAYMLDDAVLLTIATVTLRHGRLQERGARALKLLSGIVMLVLALLLLFRPDLLARLGG
jgi:glutaredoxin